MFDREIYQEWELHQDATQLEIKYKFFVRTVDIISIKALIKNVNGVQEQITIPQLIKEWQNKQLTKIVQQFFKILPQYDFEKIEGFQSLSIFPKALFILGDILNQLKQTNYKANELEVYYEPRMFQVVQSKLPLKLLEQWIEQMSNRISAIVIQEPFKKLSFEIKVNQENIDNVVWILENLCLSFKDITNWYNKQFAIRDLPPQEKNIIINIMNHLIVYVLTDFYVKLYFIYARNKNFNEVYNLVLTNIKSLLSQGKFAICALREISKFLNHLVSNELIKQNDSIVQNFLDILKIACSKTNAIYFQEIIFAKSISNDTNEELYSSPKKVDEDSNRTVQEHKPDELEVLDDDSDDERINFVETTDLDSANPDEEIIVIDNSDKEPVNPIEHEIEQLSHRTTVSNPTKKIKTMPIHIPNKTYNINRIELANRPSANNTYRNISVDKTRNFNSTKTLSTNKVSDNDEIQQIINKKTSSLIHSKPTINLTKNIKDDNNFNDRKD